MAKPKQKTRRRAKAKSKPPTSNESATVATGVVVSTPRRKDGHTNETLGRLAVLMNPDILERFRIHCLRIHKKPGHIVEGLIRTHLDGK